MAHIEAIENQTNKQNTKRNESSTEIWENIFALAHERQV